MDHNFAKTMQGISDIFRENQQDLNVIHGVRIEALAGG